MQSWDSEDSLNDRLLMGLLIGQLSDSMLALSFPPIHTMNMIEFPPAGSVANTLTLNRAKDDLE